MMQGTTLLLILSTVLFAAAGQLFIRAGAKHLAGLDGLEFLLAAAWNVYVLSGLATWTVSTLSWPDRYWSCVLALGQLSLS